MNDRAPHHPEARTMAAFVDGTLAATEIPAVAAHLRGCEECRIVVTETAHFSEEERETQSPRVLRWTPRWTWAAAAAVLVALLAAIPWLQSQRATPMEKLIAAAPRESRTVTARLAGFPWARVRAEQRGTASPTPAELKLGGVAGEVLEQQFASPHEQGVAYLLIGRTADSIAALEEAARSSSDAHVWNDLAAAHYAAAMDDHPSHLPPALAAADRAIALQSTLAEAHFNRALIIEAIGAKEQARKAWHRYLELDPAGEWSTEAREHLRKLDATSQRFDPKLLQQMPAATLSRAFPREARTWGEGVVLGEWADAVAAHDTPRAASRLSLARDLGTALAALNGERLLRDAVDAIDRGDAASRTSLAAAHRAYRDARIAYQNAKLAEAERELRRAAGMFRAARSPMAPLAEYFAASAALERGEETQDELSAILRGIDASRHRALAAQIHWTLARAANGTAEWAAAVREAEASATLFRPLGEQTNAATVDAVAAHALEMMGETDLAWKKRTRALTTFCDGTQNDRCRGLLLDSAVAVAAVDRPTAALALIDLSIDEDVTRDPVRLAVQLAKRASIASRLGDRPLIAASLTAARNAATRIPDIALRELTVAHLDVADPNSDIATLDRAIAFYDARRLGHFTANARLQRARAHRRAGHLDAAAADLEAALADVESQQASIRDGNLRLAFLDTAGQVIDEAIDLALARGDAAAALDVADRRDLDRGNVRASSVRPPRGTAIIEYAALPGSLVLFCLTHDGIEHVNVAVPRDELSRRASAVADLIRRRAPADQIRTHAAALHRVLIAPIRAQLAGAQELVIVPDRRLVRVPFAALYDETRSRYLVEEYSIRIARNASSPAVTSSETNSPALVVADPAAPGAPRLQASREEAERVASLYGATLLAGDTADRAHFLDAAVTSALIHYAGHADSDATSYGALLLAGPDGLLGARDIARLTLTRRPLVVLAACGTSRSDPVHGSGMASLTNAFLAAGARAVIGTLWEIDDDASALLFSRFHERLRAGVSPARALREAQLELLHSGDARMQHPASWSAIALFGNT